jgi:hypothetical protein
LLKKVQIEPAELTTPICTGDAGNLSLTPASILNQFFERRNL